MGGIIYETYNEENGKPWTGCCHIVDNAGWLWKQQETADNTASDNTANDTSDTSVKEETKTAEMLRLVF